MALKTVPGKEDAGRVFGIPRRGRFMGIGWLFIGLGSLNLVFNPGSGPIVGTLVMWACGLMMLRWAYYARLRISAAGVECGYELYHYATSWDNIERIEAAPIGPRGAPMDCLVLRQPGGEVAGLLTLHATEEMRTRIPLGVYSDQWREGEIGQEIQRYAPRLMV